MLIHPRLRRVLAAIAVAVLAGCAVPGVPGASPPTAGPSCDPPAGLGEGIEGLQAYGLEHREEFGGMYVDPPGGRHVVMLFTDGLADHSCAAEAIQPGTTVRAVAHTEAELMAVIEAIDHAALAAEGIEVIGAGVDVIANRATLEAKSNDPTIEARLELAHGGLLDVTIHPLPGQWANTEAGDGWRLVAAGEAAATEAYTVRAATREDAWAEMWDAIGLGGEPPAVDLTTEVTVSFGHGIGSSCREIRLDDVAVADGLAFSVTSDPLAPRACTADLAGAAVFVVAISRDSLPDDGFTLRLSERAVTCGAECGSIEEIDVPLP